ncbi:MAG: hypothetical protein V2B18_04175 [Pseudomonadota bacterium]
MGRLLCIIPAIVLLTAPWVFAGTFEVLAKAGEVQGADPLAIAPGTFVKAEFKSTTKKNAEIEIESDAAVPERTAGRALADTKSKSASADRGRKMGLMAPPPDAAPRDDSSEALAQAKDRGEDLDLDLEKDLVLSPPPPKTAEKTEPKAAPGPAPEPRVDYVGPPQRKAAAEPKAVKPASAPPVKVKPQHSAAGPKQIQKVKPLTQSAWSIPAGSYAPTANAPLVTRRAVQEQPLRRVALPSMSERFVRDGVTVKLAPRPVGAMAAVAGEPEDDLASDLLSTAAEVIGMPFAFISSLF